MHDASVKTLPTTWWQINYMHLLPNYEWIRR